MFMRFLIYFLIFSFGQVFVHTQTFDIAAKSAKEDLDKALNENLIFGAGIDVFKKEPPENNNPLLKNEKVYLSPHTAAFTDECMTRMGKETIQNIIDFFEEKLEKSKIVKL